MRKRGEIRKRKEKKKQFVRKPVNAIVKSTPHPLSQTLTQLISLLLRVSSNVHSRQDIHL